MGIHGFPAVFPTPSERETGNAAAPLHPHHALPFLLEVSELRLLLITSPFKHKSQQLEPPGFLLSRAVCSEKARPALCTKILLGRRRTPARDPAGQGRAPSEASLGPRHRAVCHRWEHKRGHPRPFGGQIMVPIYRPENPGFRAECRSEPWPWSPPNPSLLSRRVAPAKSQVM